jgi:hypothetical protein
MENSPYQEPNSHSTSHEILHLLWNQNINYCVHMSQKNSLHPPNLTVRTSVTPTYFTVVNNSKVQGPE